MIYIELRIQRYGSCNIPYDVLSVMLFSSLLFVIVLPSYMRWQVALQLPQGIVPCFMDGDGT